MEPRLIHIDAKVKRTIEKASDWYIENRNRQFAKTMLRNFAKTIETTAAMPTIGKVYKTINGIEYRSIVAHKGSIIYYHYTDTDIYFDSIVFTRNNP